MVDLFECLIQSIVGKGQAIIHNIDLAVILIQLQVSMSRTRSARYPAKEMQEQARHAVKDTPTRLKHRVCHMLRC